MFRILSLFALVTVACGAIMPQYNMTQTFGDPNAVGEGKMINVDMPDYVCTARVYVNQELCDYPQYLEVRIFDWQPIKYIVLNNPTKKYSSIDILRSEPCAGPTSPGIVAIC